MRFSYLFILFAILFNLSAFAKGDQIFCSQYAQKAVKQNQQNLQQQCGFKGLRWSDDKKGQMQWCMTVREEIPSSENKARQDLLDSCQQLSTAKPIEPSQTPDPKKMEQSIKYPRVQQLFPQTSIKTSLQKLGFKNLNSFFEDNRIPIFNNTLSASGQWLAQGSASTNDSSLKIWDLEQSRLLYLIGEEQGKAYFRLSFSPDEKSLVAGDNETTDIWDWKKPSLLFRIKDHFLPSYQAFDGHGKVYLIHKDRNSVARYDLSTGAQEEKWEIATNQEEIRSFSVSEKGDIAVTILTSKGVLLKVYDTHNNKLIYGENIPPYSIYDTKGNYLSGRGLGFIDNQHLAFYSLEAADKKPQLAILNLTSNSIESTKAIDDAGIFMNDLNQIISEKVFCPNNISPTGWIDLKEMECTLKNQQIQKDRILSTYQIRLKNHNSRNIQMLHDIKGNLLAYFGADSSGRWFWFDAQVSILTNASALWSDTLKPKIDSRIHYFPSYILPVRTNQKTVKNYEFPKADVQRLEVFMGANKKIDYKPNIKPSYGNYELSHNGRWLIVGGLDGDGIAHFDLWDTEKKAYVKSFQSKIAWTHTSLAFSPDDRYLVINYGSTRGHYAPCLECSGIIDVWDLTTSQNVFSIPRLERNNKTSGPVISDNGDMYLIVNNKAIHRWNIKRVFMIDVFRPAQDDEDIFSVIGNNEDLLAISVKKKLRNENRSIKSATSWIEIWSKSNQKMIQKINIMDKLVRGGMEFNSVFVTNNKIAIATRLNDIIIWDALKGKKLNILVPTKTEFSFTYQLSSEGNDTLISSAKFLQSWDTSTGKLLKTVNACQPEMPGLPIERYTQLKEYHGFGTARVAAGKVVSTYSCPQGARSKLWDMQTGELKALYGKDHKREWFWLNDKMELKSTVAPPTVL